MRIMKVLKKMLVAATLICGAAQAGITDGKFTTAQIWDVQYYWSGTTLNASGFNNLYASVNYATQASSAARLTDAQIADAAANGRYFAFFNSTTNPGTYGLALYESNGTLYKVINNTGTFSALGNGAIFYLGNGMWGTVITPEAGYTKGQSGTFTGMDTSVSAADLTNYTYTNTTPLTAGQTASSVNSSSPTIVSTSAGTPLVSTSSSTGTTTTATTVTIGTPVSSTVVTDTRDRQPKVLNINRNTTVTTTTPVTTTVVATTPITTTTVTTPVTVTTYSDNTTTNTNGTPVTTTSVANQVVTNSSTVNDVQIASNDTQYSTRIDQMDQLNAINKRLINENLSDPLTRNKVRDGRLVSRANDATNTTMYIVGAGQRSTKSDGYNYKNDSYGIGAEHRVNPTTLVGFKYVHNDVNLMVDNGAGTMSKETFAFYATKTIDNWIVKGDVAYAQNKFATNHATPGLNLNNSAATKGVDYWAAVRVYTPDYKGLRPFVGAIHTRTIRDYAIDHGDFLSAVDYAGIRKEYGTTMAGLRYEYDFNRDWTVAGELARTNQLLSTGTISIMYNTSSRSSMLVKLVQQQQDGFYINQVQGHLKLNF